MGNGKKAVMLMTMMVVRWIYLSRKQSIQRHKSEKANYTCMPVPKRPACLLTTTSPPLAFSPCFSHFSCL